MFNQWNWPYIVYKAFLEIMALQYSRNQLLHRNWWKCAWLGLQTSHHYSTVTQQWTRPVSLLVWHSLTCLGTLRRMWCQQESQRLNNHWIKPIESACPISGTNSNFIRDYNKISVVARNVPFGPPPAECLQPVKSSTGYVVDQPNQAWDISQDLLSDKFDFASCIILYHLQDLISKISPDHLSKMAMLWVFSIIWAWIVHFWWWRKVVLWVLGVEITCAWQDNQVCGHLLSSLF